MPQSLSGKWRHCNGNCWLLRGRTWLKSLIIDCRNNWGYTSVLVSKRLPLIIAVLVIIIVIAAVAVFTLSKKTPKTSEETPAAQQAEEQPAETTSKGSIKSLIGMGKNVTCTVTYPTSDGTVNGTLYVANDKRMRTDFVTTTSQNKQIDSHMIQDQGWSYIWSSASPQGTKMKIEENVPTPTPGLQNQNVDVNTEVEYKCSDWSVDNSKFTPPSNIQFLETGQPINQTPSGTNTTNQSQKAICDQITDPQAKAACIEATSGN